MADAGLGGAEISFVYPWGEDAEPYGTPEMYRHVRHAADVAARLGLRLDVTLGSGWSFGGSHIGPEHAARTLAWERQDASPAAIDVDVTPRWPGEELVAAYIGEGFPPRGWELFERPADGTFTLHIPAGRGPRAILLAWSRPTGQQTKRSSFGAEGPMLDHYSADAVRRHLAEVGEPLLEAVPGHMLGSVFSDSLEVYGADWTAALPGKFERRRGYALLPVLCRLAAGEGQAALRHDLGRTLTELVEENMIAVCQSWAERHRTTFRIQAYGIPPVTVSSAWRAGLIEGEGWGWDALPQTRWASSAAHVLARREAGREIVSSETWTWVHSPSFRATPMDLKGEAHEHLLLGINQFIGHGWPYHDGAGVGPGGPIGPTFYAAGALDERNAWWRAMPELTAYLTRLCWLMRQGEPVADVALYLPTDDLFAAHGPATDLRREAEPFIGPEILATIRRGGWDFDVVDDAGLVELAGLEEASATYRVLVLSHVTTLPEHTREFLWTLQERGMRILAVDAPAWSEADGAVGTTPAAFDAALAELLTPDVDVIGGGGDVGCVHRRLADGDMYLLVNTGTHVREVVARPRSEHSSWHWWDPRSEVFRETTDRRIRLEPYQAVVLLGGEEEVGEPTEVRATPGTGEERRLDHGWTFACEPDSAVAEVSAHAVDLPHRWEDERTGYSGRGTYRVTIHLDPQQDAALLAEDACVVLDLGETRPAPSQEGHGPSGPSYRVQVDSPVREIAVVTVNGLPCGILWDAPFRVEVGDALQPGENELVLEVYNTTANASAADGTVARTIQAGHERYGVRFEQQDLDLTLDGVSSGLQAVPVLRVR
jgi:hypothetical protein